MSVPHPYSDILPGLVPNNSSVANRSFRQEAGEMYEEDTSAVSHYQSLHTLRGDNTGEITTVDETPDLADLIIQNRERELGIERGRDGLGEGGEGGIGESGMGQGEGGNGGIGQGGMGEEGTAGMGEGGMGMLQEGVIYSEADIERITGKVSVEKTLERNLKREKEEKRRVIKEEERKRLEARQESLQQSETEATTIADIKEMVREWMKMDDEVVLLQQAIKDRRKARDILHGKIVRFMKYHDIQQFNLNSGQLVRKESKRREGFSRNLIKRCLGQWFQGNNNKVSQIYDFMENSRESKTSYKLTRSKGD